MSKKDSRPSQPLKLRDLIAKGEGLWGAENSRYFSPPKSDTPIQNFNMEIKADGQWYHEGTAINRLPLCRLFATLLSLDDQGQYWLQTPVERGIIQVEDAPFYMVEMAVTNTNDVQIIRMRNSLDYWVTLDQDHTLKIETVEDGQPRPYIHIRDGLYGLISRAVFYELVELSYEQHDQDSQEIRYLVMSDNIAFKLN